MAKGGSRRYTPAGPATGRWRWLCWLASALNRLIMVH
jgi:hypothetical protein